MRLLALVALLLLIPAAVANPWDGADPADVSISLVTGDPGRSNSAAWYGHTGLLIESGNESRYYAYRLHIEDSPLRSTLTAFTPVEFGLHGRGWDNKLAEYDDQERTVRTALLRLDPNQTAMMLQFMEEEIALAEVAPRVYHMLSDNCSTRIRDLLDVAYGSEISAATMSQPTGQTMREHVGRYIEHEPVQAGLMYTIIGPEIDAQLSTWDAMFLPLELEQYMLDAGLIDEPVEARSYPSPAEGRGHGRLIGSAVAFGLLLAGAVAGMGVLHRRQPTRRLGRTMGVVGLICLLPSIVVTLAWTGILDSPWAWNFNVLLLSPLTAAWLVAGPLHSTGRAQRFSKISAIVQGVLALAALIVHLVGVQDLSVALAILLPVHIAAWFAFTGPAAPINFAQRRLANDALAGHDQ